MNRHVIIYRWMTIASPAPNDELEVRIGIGALKIELIA
jgi:hypothetical protein